VLAEVQGSFTFSPQQMPHASTYIKNAPLEFGGEMPLLSGVCLSCGYLNIADADGGIGAKNFCRELKASWTLNKRDVVALIRSIWGIRRGSVE
jgi:hypothetical protein